MIYWVKSGCNVHIMLFPAVTLVQKSFFMYEKKMKNSVFMVDFSKTRKKLENSIPKYIIGGRLTNISITTSATKNLHSLG